MAVCVCVCGGGGGRVADPVLFLTVALCLMGKTWKEEVGCFQNRLEACPSPAITG